MIPQLMLLQKTFYRQLLLAIGLALLALIVGACAAPQAPVATPASVPALEPSVAPTEQPSALLEPQAKGSIWTANEASDSITVIDAGTNQVLTTLTGIPGPHNLQAAPDGKSVWAVSGHGAAAVMIDTASFDVHGVVPTGKTPAHIVVTPDGKTAYASNSGDNMAVLDIGARKVVATVPTGAGPNGVTFIPGPVVAAPATQIELALPPMGQEMDMDHGG